MKRTILYFGVLVSTIAVTMFLSSCSEDGGITTPTDEDGGATDSIEITVIDSETHVYTRDSETETRTSVYNYDENGKLVSISQSGSGWTEVDTLIYSGDNIVEVRTLDSDGEEQESITFTYSGGKLMTATETDDSDGEVVVYTLTYNGDVLDGYSKTYTIGSIDTGEVSTISNIVWVDGNMASMDVTMHAEGTINASATYDDYDNPFPRIDPDDFVVMFCENNVKQAYMTSDPTELFVDNTLTYTDGMLTKIASQDEGDSSTLTLTYKTIKVLQE